MMIKTIEWENRIYRVQKTVSHGTRFRILRGNKYVGKTTDGGYTSLSAAIRYACILTTKIVN